MRTSQPILRCSILLLTLCVGVALGATGYEPPASFELDLIFPREETYALVHPFPVVFAVQNIDIAWYYGSSLYWRLYAVGSDDEVDSFFYPLPARDTFADLEGQSPPPPDQPYLLANGSVWVKGELENKLSQTFRLEWEFGTIISCTEDDEGTIYSSPSNATTGSIEFTVAYEGKPVDFTTTESSCALFGGTWNITGTIGNDDCAIAGQGLTPDEGGGDPCAVNIGEDTASTLTSLLPEMTIVSETPTSIAPGATSAPTPTGQASRRMNGLEAAKAVAACVGLGVGLVL